MAQKSEPIQQMSNPPVAELYLHDLSPLHLHVSAKETKTLRYKRMCNWPLFLQCHCQTI
jgi:hypothetical protein